MPTNRQVLLAKRPAPGLVTPDTFTVKDAPLAEPGEGEIRIKIAYVSLDPAMRGWINEGRSYVPPVAIGGVMRSFSVGIVEKVRERRLEPSRCREQVAAQAERTCVICSPLLRAVWCLRPSTSSSRRSGAIVVVVITMATTVMAVTVMMILR